MGYRTPESIPSLPFPPYDRNHHPQPQFLYDYALCEGFRELEKMLQIINESGYQLVSVTQNVWMYAVFVRRPLT